MATQSGLPGAGALADTLSNIFGGSPSQVTGVVNRIPELDPLKLFNEEVMQSWQDADLPWYLAAPVEVTDFFIPDNVMQLLLDIALIPIGGAVGKVGGKAATKVAGGALRYLGKTKSGQWIVSYIDKGGQLVKTTIDKVPSKNEVVDFFKNAASKLRKEGNEEVADKVDELAGGIDNLSDDAFERTLAEQSENIANARGTNNVNSADDITDTDVLPTQKPIEEVEGERIQAQLFPPEETAAKTATVADEVVAETLEETPTWTPWVRDPKVLEKQGTLEAKLLDEYQADYIGFLQNLAETEARQTAGTAAKTATVADDVVAETLETPARQAAGTAATTAAGRTAGALADDTITEASDIALALSRSERGGRQAGRAAGFLGPRVMSVSTDNTIDPIFEGTNDWYTPPPQQESVDWDSYLSESGEMFAQATASWDKALANLEQRRENMWELSGTVIADYDKRIASVEPGSMEHSILTAAKGDFQRALLAENAALGAESNELNMARAQMLANIAESDKDRRIRIQLASQQNATDQIAARETDVINQYMTKKWSNPQLQEMLAKFPVQGARYEQALNMARGNNLTPLIDFKATIAGEFGANGFDDNEKDFINLTSQDSQQILHNIFTPVETPTGAYQPSAYQ